MQIWKHTKNIKKGIVKEKTLTMEGRSIYYLHKINARSRGIRLAIHHDGTCRVTTSHRVLDKFVEATLREKFDWIVEKMDHFKNNPRKVLGTGDVKDFERHKDGAMIKVMERLNHFNRFYSYRWNKVTIKNTKSRWGSCSKMGNLNFSYKLALLPPHLTDYIVVHELCHLKEMNHGKNFWKLVAQTIPNYRDLRRQLKGIV